MMAIAARVKNILFIDCSFGIRLLRSDRLAFFFPRAGENANHRIVRLVTGILVDRPLGGAQHHFRAPRLRINLRVINAELIENRVVGDSGKAFLDLGVGRNVELVAQAKAHRRVGMGSPC